MGDHEEEQENKKEKGVGRCATSFNLVKATIGAGSTGLPFAFKQGGPALFIFGVTLFMGVLCAYTIVLLAQSERELFKKSSKGGPSSAHVEQHDAEQRLLKSGQEQHDAEKPLLKSASLSDNATIQQPHSDQGNAAHTQALQEEAAPWDRILTFPEVGRAAFPDLTYFIYGMQVNVVELLLHAVVQVIVLGVCVAYIDFIANTLPSLWPNVFNQGYSILLVTPFFLCTAYLRSFGVLAITSVIGNVAVISALVAVVCYGFLSPDYGVLKMPSTPITSELIGSVQTVTFLFAVQANMLPIAQAMVDPEKSFPTTLYMTFTFIVFVNAAFGLLCFMLFGEDTASPVTLNLGCRPGGLQDGQCVHQSELTPAVQAVVVGVQVLLCVDLMFTLPILLAAAREIIENLIVGMLHKDSSVFKIEMTRNATRTALVLLIVLVSYLVPNFSIILKFLGGLFQSIIAFIIPPLVYNRTFSNHIPGWKYGLNIAITLFGVVMAVISVVTLFVSL